jgi:plasmid stabilization system protein ParE
MGVTPLAIAWAAPAEASLDRILSYIEAENPAVARKLWGRLMEALEQAAAFPELAPHIPDLSRAYRELLAVRPFRLVYRTEGTVLRVIAVMRQEQDFDPQRFLEEA